MQNKKPKILITGGAGYIGSHIVHTLLQQNKTCLVLDDLSTGFINSIPESILIQGNIGDTALLKSIFDEHNIESVMHFAAHTIVEESMQNPMKYYRNNFANTTTLLEACAHHNVKNFIFSSTAAVYGIPTNNPVKEIAECRPINPYGLSKHMCEQSMLDLAKIGKINFISLRYFNVAGSTPDGMLGPFQKNSTLLIRRVLQTALGKFPYVSIFGDDYDTHDGTGIRDYIHVVDIANAHIDALHYLEHENTSHILNCGYGHGYSVKEIIKAAENVTGKIIPIEIKPRRAGDPACVVGDNTQIQKIVHWKPKFDDLHTIIEHAYQWEKKLLA